MWALLGFLTLQWFVLYDYATLVDRKVGSHSLPGTGDPWVRALADGSAAQTHSGKPVR